MHTESMNISSYIEKVHFVLLLYVSLLRIDEKTLRVVKLFATLVEAILLACFYVSNVYASK